MGSSEEVEGVLYVIVIEHEVLCEERGIEASEDLAPRHGYFDGGPSTDVPNE